MAAQRAGSMDPGEFLSKAVLHRYSRREIIRRGTALGFSASVIGMVLAACGGGDGDNEGAGDAALIATTATIEPTATTAVPATSANTNAPTTADSDDSIDNSEPTGSIVISLAEEPLTMEHWGSYNRWGFPILRNVMEALINRHPQTNELVPELALSWEQVDELTWQFKLREGVTFHNGEPFDAEAAAFVLNDIWSPENAFSILSMMGPQISATAVDQYILNVATESPDPILPTRLYFSPISSMQQLMEDRESTKVHPIGTGPYTFVEWVQGQHVLLTVNPDWWGHGGNDPNGQVTIKDVEFQFRIESTVRAAQISAGEAKLANQLSPEDCETVPVCETVPSLETSLIRLDTMHPVMADIRVREAMAHAIDTKTVCEQIYVNSLPASQIYGPAVLGYNDSLTPYPYDLDRANELVQQAQADGVPTEMPLTIVCTAVLPGHTETIQYVAEQLNQIGLNVESQVLESAQWSPAIYGTAQQDVPLDRGYLALTNHGNELMDASASLTRYYSCNPDSDSTYCNQELDPKIEEAVELEGEEREVALQELMAALYDEYAILPIGHLQFCYGMAEDVSWTPRVDSLILLKEMSLT